MDLQLQTVFRATVLAGFLAFLLLVPAMQSTESGGDSRENRELASLPDWPHDAETWLEFPQAFSDYMDDNFGFREVFLRLHNEVLLAMGVSPSDKVILGKSGWLFYEHYQLTDQNRGALPLEPRWLHRYLVGFQNQRRWVEKRGISHLLLPTPDKNTIHPEYLPDWARPAAPSRFRQVLDHLDAAGEPYVDVTPALEQARDRGERVYLMTDTHWSCLGAWHAYHALMDEVEKTDLAGIHRLTAGDVSFTDSPPEPGGDMARNMLMMEDIVREQRAVRCEFINPPDITATRLSDGFVARDPLKQRSQQQRWRYTRHAADTEPASRVLLIRDSYSHALIPYLMMTFEELTVVPRPRMILNPEEFAGPEPDLVIYQFVERALIWVPRIQRK